MTMSIEANKTNEANALLSELDELMDYMDEGVQKSTAQSSEFVSDEEMKDPSFFIGNMDENVADVPTLTTVASDMVTKPKTAEPTADAPTKQPGLFSARMERLKQQDQQTEAKADPEVATESQSLNDEKILAIVDTLIAEQLPKIEVELRKRILSALSEKK